MGCGDIRPRPLASIALLPPRTRSAIGVRPYRVVDDLVCVVVVFNGDESYPQYFADAIAAAAAIEAGDDPQSLVADRFIRLWYRGHGGNKARAVELVRSSIHSSTTMRTQVRPKTRRTEKEDRVSRRRERETEEEGSGDRRRRRRRRSRISWLSSFFGWIRSGGEHLIAPWDWWMLAGSLWAPPVPSRVPFCNPYRDVQVGLSAVPAARQSRCCMVVLSPCRYPTETCRSWDGWGNWV